MKFRPCAVSRPIALTSVMNSRSAASFCPPLTMPNSAACLIAVRGVAAGIGQTDDLGLRRLRLQQERREIRGVQRMLDAADDLAAIGRDHGRGVALERGAEGVVRGEEEPAIAAGLHQRLPGAMGQHVGVVGPVHGVRRALRVGEIRGRRARIDVDAVLFLDDIVDRERDAGIRHVDDDVDLVDVEPLPRDIRRRRRACSGDRRR